MGLFWMKIFKRNRMKPQMNKRINMKKMVKKPIDQIYAKDFGKIFMKIQNLQRNRKVKNINWNLKEKKM